MCASKVKRGIKSALPIGRQVFCHLQQSKAPSHTTVTWEDKCHNSEHRPVSSFLSLVGWSFLGRLCSNFLPSPSLLLGETEKALPMIRNKIIKYGCLINTVYITNPKHGTIQVLMKTINSISAKTSTLLY